MRITKLENHWVELIIIHKQKDVRKYTALIQASGLIKQNMKGD